MKRRRALRTTRMAIVMVAAGMPQLDVTKAEARDRGAYLYSQ